MQLFNKVEELLNKQSNMEISGNILVIENEKKMIKLEERLNNKLNQVFTVTVNELLHKLVINLYLYLNYNLNFKVLQLN